MVLILSEKLSQRLEYTVKYIFKELMGVEFRITSSRDEFRSFSGAKLVYASKNLVPDVPWMYSQGLLNETALRMDISVNPEIRNGMPVLFPYHEDNMIVPFDLFSSVFFLVSRYEEYLPFTPDPHGRFEAGSSRLYPSGFFKRPLINEWVNHLKNILTVIFPEFNPPDQKFGFQLTFDIDSAWAYKNRGVLRSLGGYYNSAKRLSVNELVDRTLVLTNLRPDPFDTFDYILNICNQYNTHPVFFILAGKFGRYNKNIHPENLVFRNLLKRIVQQGEIGIHPSYESFDDASVYKNEIHILSQITEKAIVKSRQHFLRMRLPDTYRILIREGITEDYSMGYAGSTGFRAGTCSPFYFYDLPAETETKLKIFPVSIMEGTLKDYMKLEPDEAIESVQKVIHQIKMVNGTFIPLWHNESLSDKGKWKGWRRVFEEMMKLVTCVW